MMMMILSVRELNGFNTLLEYLPDRFVSDEVLATKFLSWWSVQKISRENASYIVDHSSLLDVTQELLDSDKVSFECLVFLLNVWKPLVPAVVTRYSNHIIRLLNKCYGQYWDNSSVRVAWLSVLLSLYEHDDEHYKSIQERVDIILTCVKDSCFAVKQAAMQVVFSLLRKMKQHSEAAAVLLPIIAQTFTLNKSSPTLSKQEVDDKIALWNELAKFDFSTFAYLSDKIDLITDLCSHVNTFSTSLSLTDLSELTRLVQSLLNAKQNIGDVLSTLKCWPQQLVSMGQLSLAVNAQCALLASGLLTDYEGQLAWNLVMSCVDTNSAQCHTADAWLHAVNYLLSRNTQVTDRVTGDIVNLLTRVLQDQVIPDKTVRLVHACLRLALSKKKLLLVGSHQASAVFCQVLQACLRVGNTPATSTVGKLATLKTLSEAVTSGQSSWSDTWQDTGMTLTDQLTTLLTTTMCDIDWAVRDSSIELVSTLTSLHAGEREFSEWVDRCSLVSHLWPCTLPGGEGYVRASALDAIGQLLSADLCRPSVLAVVSSGDIVSSVLAAVQAGGNENMFVRRAGVRLLVTMTTRSLCDVAEAVNCARWVLFDEDSEVCRHGLDLVHVCLSVISNSLQVCDSGSGKSYVTACSNCHLLYCPLVHLCWTHVLHSIEDLPPELVSQALSLAGDMQALDDRCHSGQAVDRCQCVTECNQLRHTLDSARQRLADDSVTSGVNNKTYIEALLDDIVLSLEARHAAHSDDEGFIMDCY